MAKKQVRRATAKASKVAKRASSPKRSKSSTKSRTPAKAANRNRAKAAARKAPASPPIQRSAVSSITPFLWFNGNFAEAARFYVKLFPDSSLDAVHDMGGSFTLAGQRFMGLNGGPQYQFSPAVSFFVICRDQKEVDRLWSALEDGGTPSRCGWIDDKFGVTWQIIPEAFLRLTSDPDPRKVGAVFEAMMEMVKLDVKGLQAAYDAA